MPWKKYQETGNDKMSIVWKTGAAAERFRFKNKKRKKRQAPSFKQQAPAGLKKDTIK